VPTPEPYASRRSHGMVLAEDGRKMSKSFGNVINPDEIVKKFGADTLRMYEMFMGPFEQAINWNNQGVVGIYRFLNRVWQLSRKNFVDLDKFVDLNRLLHQSIKKISEDLEEMKFNTAVSQLMILVNEFEKHEKLPGNIYETFLKILAPFAPHLAEELWQEQKATRDKGQGTRKFKSIHQEAWPKYNPRLIQEDTFELVIQINGKVRDKVLVSKEITEKEAQALALAQEKVKKWLEDKKVIKIIFVPGKLINIVI
jgi:leucyl-tRNA synthetase